MTKKKLKPRVECLTSNRYVSFSAVDSEDLFVDPVAHRSLDLSAKNHKELADSLRKTADFIEKHNKYIVEINSSN